MPGLLVKGSNTKRNLYSSSFVFSYLACHEYVGFYDKLSNLLAMGMAIQPIVRFFTTGDACVQICTDTLGCDHHILWDVTWNRHNISQYSMIALIMIHPHVAMRKWLVRNAHISGTVHGGADLLVQMTCIQSLIWGDHFVSLYHEDRQTLAAQFFVAQKWGFNFRGPPPKALY